MPSFVSKKDIIDRDEGVSIMLLELEQEAEKLKLEREQKAKKISAAATSVPPQLTYTQQLLVDAENSRTEAPFYISSSTNLCVERGTGVSTRVATRDRQPEEPVDEDYLPDVIVYDNTTNPPPLPYPYPAFTYRGNEEPQFVFEPAAASLPRASSIDHTRKRAAAEMEAAAETTTSNLLSKRTKA
jgi:hypothetical protein